MIKVRQVLLCSAVPFFFLAASCVRENSSRKQDIHVQQMSGFPNQEFGYELGVSACYAGIIGNKLVMAGGCNFAGKSAAEGGPKYFYKGIYTAEITEDSVLVWKQVGELPSPVAYGVSISRSGEMILIGGNNADGGLTSVFRLKLAEDGGAILDTLPSLPFALDNMSGAASGNTIYVAGGNRNGSPSTSMLSLDLNEPELGWKEEVPFPGAARVQPVCAVQDGMLYLWGGFCPSQNGGEASVATDGYRYLPLQERWEPVPAPAVAETGEPLTLTGGTSCVWSDSIILCTGGVDKDIFLDAISGDYKRIAKEDYLLQPVAWYRFNGRLMAYNTRRNHWEEWEESACLARAGAALLGKGQQLFIVGGELKPGIRTAEISRITIK